MIGDERHPSVDLIGSKPSSMMTTARHLTCLARSRDQRWTLPITWPAWIKAVTGDEHHPSLDLLGSKPCVPIRTTHRTCRRKAMIGNDNHLSHILLEWSCVSPLEMILRHGIFRPLWKEVHMHLICPPHSPYSDCSIGGELRRGTPPPHILTTCTLDLWCVGFGGWIGRRWFAACGIVSWCRLVPVENKTLTTPAAGKIRSRAFPRQAFLYLGSRVYVRVVSASSYQQLPAQSTEQSIYC
jgi:hypothetical protein